jgi:DNA-binding MarR family transcriptional regulator
MQDKRSTLHDPKLRASLGYSLVRVFRQLNRETSRILRPLGLTAEQAHVLLVLWLEGPLKIGRLQRVLMLSSATLTGAVDRMEKAGLVRRVADPEDGRAWRIEPTEAANRSRKKVEAALTILEEEAFRALDATERRRLKAILDKLEATLPE